MARRHVTPPRGVQLGDARGTRAEGRGAEGHGPMETGRPADRLLITVTRRDETRRREAVVLRLQTTGALI